MTVRQGEGVNWLFLSKKVATTTSMRSRGELCIDMAMFRGIFETKNTLHLCFSFIS